MKQLPTTSTTKNRANVRHAVSSQFAKFGFGRKDAGIKTLFSVAEERCATFFVPSESSAVN